MNARRYELNIDTAFDHFSKKINGSNELSSTVFRLLDLKKNGRFFTILPDGVNIGNIHKFDQGGIFNNSQEEIILFMLKILLSNSDFSFVFDDVLEEYKDLVEYKLFVSNGFCYKTEAYYVIQAKNNPDRDLISECLEAADAEWHCLGVLTSASFDKLKNKELTIAMIRDICVDAKIIMTTAYDGEGYIFWEKS